MAKRRAPSQAVEEQVLIASGRRCCLCVYLNGQDVVKKGQIAHLNGDPVDSGYENLVFLCLDHHDEYDSRTSQSKGLTEGEIRRYRKMLYADRAKRYGAVVNVESGSNGDALETANLDPLDETRHYQSVRTRFRKQLAFLSEPWKFTLWGIANDPQLFAYKAANRCDGVCMIERIDLPDGRIVVACMAMEGNPGQSITNSVEELCFQVCERLNIPADRLVWLEYYDFIDPKEWLWVKFSRNPPDGPFENPSWTAMTPALWQSLMLEPRPLPSGRQIRSESKLRKLFTWPPEQPPEET